MQCKNCRRPLSEEANFCDHCGARVVTDKLTFGYLAGEISERFFNVENNLILRTFKDMFRRPEAVIHDYIHGTRKQHLNVANYLALAITLSGLQIFLMQKFFMGNMDMTWMSFGNSPVVEETSGMMDAIWEYQSLFYVILIPIYAFWAYLTFINIKKYSYLHHIVIVAYTQSHLSIAMFLPSLVLLLLGINFFKVVYFLSFPFMIIYTAYCYKRLYALSLGRIIWKTILFLMISGFCYIGISMAVGIIMALTGLMDVNEIMKAQQ